MKEDKIVLTEKRYRQLWKRRNEIWQLRRKLPWRKLEEPYQDGWMITIDLIDEAKRRKDGPRMQEALALCAQRPYVTRDSKRISRIRKSDEMSEMKSLFKEQNHRGEYIYHGPELSVLKQTKWLDLHPSVKKLFEKRVHRYVSPWGGQENITVNYALDIPEHYLTMKVKKRIVTHVQDINPQLEKELKEIEDDLQPYYRSFGAYGRDWNEGSNVQRRHIKDALQKIKKGEIQEVGEYRKATKIKNK